MSSWRQWPHTARRAVARAGLIPSTFTHLQRAGVVAADHFEVGVVTGCERARLGRGRRRAARIALIFLGEALRQEFLVRRLLSQLQKPRAFFFEDVMQDGAADMLELVQPSLAAGVDALK